MGEINEIKNTGSIPIQLSYLQTLLDNTEDMVVVFDKELRIMLMNKKCEAAFKIKAEDVTGKIVFDLFPFVKNSQSHQDLLDAFAGKTIKNKAKKSSSISLYFDNCVTPVRDEAGEIFAVMAIARDITEIINSTHDVEKANERFNVQNERLQERNLFVENILNASVDVIMVLDRKRKIIALNATAYSILSPFNDKPIGKKIEEILPHVKDTNAWKIFYSVLHGEKAEIKEYKSLVNDKYWEMNFSPLIKNNITEAVMIICHDITEIVGTKKQLEESNVSLERLNKESQSFAYVASHDLQEPLRKIQFFSNLILQKENEHLTNSGKDYFRRMQEAASRMQVLIEDLLSFSRTNNAEEKFEKLSLNKIVEDVLHEMRETIQEKKAVIHIGTMLEADVIPFQFRQLVQNLLSNALKFSKKDTNAVIDISTALINNKQAKALSLNGDMPYFLLSVKDNGIGFEPEFKYRIFEIFQRLHGKHEYKGTGIGLAICKKIVENHQGVIIAESKPGEGSIFKIYMPVQQKAKP